MGEAAVRGALGISLDDLAKHLGVSRGTLTKYELSPRTGVEDARKREAIARFYRGLDNLIRSTKGSAKGRSRDEADGLVRGAEGSR